MWSRDHYQFFPLVLIVAAWLGYRNFQNIPKAEAAPSGISVRTVIYSAVSFFAFALAVLSDSHWIGVVSCLIQLWTLVWIWGGTPAATSLWRVWVMLALIIPLPLNLDLLLITKLQRLATQFASGGLDLARIDHSVSGVVIRTTSKSYLVEEACSGIHSLFSAVSLVLFLATLSNYGLIRLLLSAAQATLWVIVGNTFRVFLVVYCFERYQVEIDRGWSHDLLGFLIFAFVIVASASLDRFFRFLVPVMEQGVGYDHVDSVIQLQRHAKNFFSRFLDQLLLRGSRLRNAMVLFSLGTQSALLAIGMTKGLASAGAGETSQASDLNWFASIAESWAPESLRGWTRLGFQRVERESGDPLGGYSFVWNFRGHGMVAGVSIDGVYPEFHDLTYCYTGLGWTVLQAQNLTAKSGDTQIPYTKLLLYRDSGEQALVLFSCFDAKNTPVTPPPITGSLLRNIENRIGNFGLVFDQSSRPVPPVFQFQLFGASNREFMPHELEALEGLFIDARNTIYRDQLGGK